MSGLDHIKESIVLAQILSVPGQPYHRAVADRDIVRLDKLGVFGSIRVEAIAVDDGVRIELTLNETPRYIPAVALAVTDENGVSAGPAIKLTSIKGHPLDVGITTRFGGETLFQFHETSQPFTNRRLWQDVHLSLSEHYNKLDDFEQKLDRSRLARRRAPVGGVAGRRHLQGTTASAATSPTSRCRPTTATPSTATGRSREYDDRDSWREPSRGWYASADGLWTAGSGDYGTVDIDVRRYNPIRPRQTIVATALVTLQSGTDGVDLPTYSDYALGGENTVRGHGFGAVRGKNQLISTLEYRYSLLPTRSFRVGGMNFYGGLALAAFGDVGSAWSDADGFSDGVIGGWGIGLRVYIPYVNMIRLDLSFGDGTHGGFGINEKAVAQRNRVR